MALTITYVPGYVWTIGELVTEDKLNQSANPTINLEGTISSSSVADGAITTPKLAVGVLSADAAGRSKMADQFLTAAKLGSDVAGLGLTGGAGAAIDVNPDGITVEINADKVRVKSTGAGVIAGVRNLIAQNNAVAPNSKADVAADEVLLKDSSSNPFLAIAASVTVDITASGANGLDTGAEASSTWYYVWLIAKSDATVAGLLSVSATAPTMPAGYTYKGLVGAVRNSGASNFLTFYQQDRRVWITDTNIFTDKAAAVADTYEAYQAGGGGSDVDLRTILPPIAKHVAGTAGNSNSGNEHAVAVAGDSSGLGAVTVAVARFSGVSTLSGFSAGSHFRVPLKEAQKFYWKAVNTTARGRVNVSGYEI